MDYKPHPIDTSGIKLSEDILELTELLARNTHEIWAQQRLSEHWHYGAERNDKRMEHPGLVSYEELSEVEKQYDRNTALETLKTILSLGYRIEPPARTQDADGALVAASGDLDAIMEVLSQPDALDLNKLLALWQTREVARWARNPEIYRRLGERLNKLGEMLLAYDVISEGRKYWPGDLRLRQLQAHALSRLGATTRANSLLTALYAEGQRDEETLGMLARTHKDLWAQATDPAARQEQLQHSYKFYEEAYRLSGGYWTGINAATIALLSGEREHARALAGEVRELCLAELRRLEETGGADRYWPLATLGEAALVSEDWTEAARWYAEAAASGRRRPGELASTRRNARLIIDYLGGDPSFIDRHLPAPKVVVFGAQYEGASPHQGAAESDLYTRAEEHAEASERRVILERLSELNAGVGYAAVPSSGASAFLEAMLEAGGETHIVMPCQLTELLKTERVGNSAGANNESGDSEGDDGGGDAAQNARSARYESLLPRVTSIVAASEQNMSVSGMSEEYARLLLQGLALIRARQLDTELVAFTLRNDGAQGDASASVANTAPVAQIEEAFGFNARIAALLFADAVNFSKLTEAQTPAFVRHFLGAIGTLVARFEPAPLFRNTWGDGLYLVFADVEAAGRFALDLSDLLNATDWTEHGLPAELNLRIALHAGPVYGCTDPVTRKINFIGTHVSRAARIEPITPPGHVYASQAFAALATAQRVTDFTCDYVGQTPLAKKYGSFPTYHVRRL